MDNLKIKKMEENSLKDIRRKLEDKNKRKEEWNMDRDKMEKRIRDLKENRKKGINKRERGKNSNSKIKSYRRKRRKRRGRGEKEKRYNKWHQRKRRGSKVWDRRCLRK